VAGFALAHATWSVSDLEEGELLCPLAFVQRSDRLDLARFEAPSQEQAISNGKEAMRRLDSSVAAWAFAREGLYRENSDGVDVISVDFWAPGMGSPATLLQRFVPNAGTGKFRLIGEPTLVVDGVAQRPEEASASLELVLSGVQQHPKVASLWNSWK
jgi:hypothetical protein